MKRNNSKKITRSLFVKQKSEKDALAVYCNASLKDLCHFINFFKRCKLICSMEIKYLAFSSTFFLQFTFKKE